MVMSTARGRLRCSAANAGARPRSNAFQVCHEPRLTPVSRSAPPFCVLPKPPDPNGALAPPEGEGCAVASTTAGALPVSHGAVLPSQAPVRALLLDAVADIVRCRRGRCQLGGQPGLLNFPRSRRRLTRNSTKRGVRASSLCFKTARGVEGSHRTPHRFRVAQWGPPYLWLGSARSSPYV
jgi:hypothetical protein